LNPVMHLYTKNVAIAGARRARGVAAGADAEINLFRRGSRASRFFRAAGPHSRKNLDVARARRARAFEFERSVVSVGAAFPSSDARARVGRRPSSRASRDARARRTATRARVPRRRRRRRRRPTRSSRVVVVERASSSSSSSRAASFIVRGRAAPARNLTRRGRCSI